MCGAAEVRLHSASTAYDIATHEVDDGRLVDRWRRLVRVRVRVRVS